MPNLTRPSDTLTQIRERYSAARAAYASSRAYPDDFRRLVGKYVGTCRADGVPWRALAREVGVATTSLQSWRTEFSGNPRLVSVEVVDATPAIEQVLSSPRGFQLAGLSLDHAAELLGRLG